MEENYLIAVFVAFLFSFVLFKKDKTIINKVGRKPRKSNQNISGTTGVAKYLSQHDASESESNVTGVARYLKEKNIDSLESAEVTLVSGVAKYLAGKEQASASGVSKYMAKQVIQAKKLAKENASGVEKYLSKRR